MAFSVQDEIGSVDDANAYIAVAFFTAFHTDRNVAKVVNGDYETADVQGAIILATDYLDSRYRYIGSRRSARQVTDWPRYDAEDSDEYLVTGIPHQVQEACAELALAELEVPGSLFPTVAATSSGQAVKKTSSKLDVLETSIEYFGGDSATAAVRSPVFFQAEWRLKRSGLLASNRSVARG